MPRSQTHDPKAENSATIKLNKNPMVSFSGGFAFSIEPESDSWDGDKAQCTGFHPLSSGSLSGNNRKIPKVAVLPGRFSLILGRLGGRTLHQGDRKPDDHEI